MDHIALQARQQPTHLALHDLASGQKWTYAALDAAIDRCSGLLTTTHGLQHGDRLAALSKNRAVLVILHFACARMGFIYVPLNWRLSTAEIEDLIADADPALLIGDQTLESVQSTIPRQEITRFETEITTAAPRPRYNQNPDHPSLILYTSGTSGKPKGAILSERNLDQTAINFSALGKVTHESVFLCDSPMFHIIGLITNVRPTFLQGGTLLVSDGFDPKRTLARMADPSLKITHYFGVPQMAAMLRQEPAYDPIKLQHMTGIFTGGAPHPKADIEAWLKDGIPVMDGYGMSEAGTVFGMPVDRALIRQKAGSVGIGTPAIGARIVTATGEDCPVGTAGELLLRGANITAGYWRQPDASAASFTADGWFQTGDIAIQDTDGFYFLVDRKKDMFISGGENVYPAEVEAALAGMDAILEAAIIGVPDARWGEVGHLAVVCKPNKTVDMPAVSAWLSPKLARYKLPKYLTCLDSLPRTGSGKIQKNILREKLATTH